MGERVKQSLELYLCSLYNAMIIVGKPCDQGGTKSPCTDKCRYNGLPAMPSNLIFSHKEGKMVWVATGSVILPALLLTGHANRFVFAREIRSVTI